MNKLLRFSTLLFFSFMLMNSTSVQAADPALTDNQGAAIPDANVILLEKVVIRILELVFLVTLKIRIIFTSCLYLLILILGSMGNLQF